MQRTIKQYVLLLNGDTVEVDLPAKRIVCPTCNGTGKHVNPAVDGHGLSAEDFDDEEFRENYFSGVYDVRCEECNGANVVDVVDEGKLTARMLRRLRSYEDSEAAYRRECEYERRYCC